MKYWMRVIIYKGLITGNWKLIDHAKIDALRQYLSEVKLQTITSIEWKNFIRR
jgi:hypothetical protein